MIGISGFRIDNVGIHDRFLRWRHFGYWEFARSVRLDTRSSYIQLLFTFEGRKRPVKVGWAKSFKNALKAAEVLESALVHAPELELDPQAEHFSNDISRYMESRDRSDADSDAETRLAKADIHLRLGQAKPARKEVEALLNRGDPLEVKARIVRLQTFFQDSDSILAQVEYDEICKLNASCEEAHSLWARWLLANERDGAEEFALELIQRVESTDNRLDIEGQLIEFLARQRRYDDALSRVDGLESMRDKLASHQQDGIDATREEIKRLKTDRKYNRRKTFWRPLLWKGVAYGVLGFCGLVLIGPAIFQTPKLWSDLTRLRELEDRGEIAQGGTFDPDLRNLDFGFVELSYRFNLRGIESQFPMHGGSDTFRRKAAKAILADTRSHSVVYLPESPNDCAIHPISKESYIGLIGIHGLSYLYPVVIFAIILYFFIVYLYKKLKYGYS